MVVATTQTTSGWNHRRRDGAGENYSNDRLPGWIEK